MIFIFVVSLLYALPCPGMYYYFFVGCCHPLQVDYEAWDAVDHTMENVCDVGIEGKHEVLSRIRVGIHVVSRI